MTDADNSGDGGSGKSDSGVERLRVDSRKVDLARLRLAAIDRAVFAAGAGHAPDDHDEIIRRTVNMLLGHG